MKKIGSEKTWLAASIIVCAATFAASIAKAQVVAQGVLTPTSFTTTNTGGFTVPYTVQSADTDVIVVGFYIDSVAGAPITDLRFNNVLRNATPLTAARASLAYFTTVPGVGTYNFTGDTTLMAEVLANGFVWELSNIDIAAGVNTDVIGNTNQSLPINNTISTSADRLVVDFFSANKQDMTAVAPALTSIITNYSALQFGGTNGGTVAGGWGVAATTGPNTLGWRSTGGTIGSPPAASELAYAFALLPSILELNVNTFTGQVEIVNPNENTVSIDYYRITSTGGALSPGSWNSLDDQDADAIGMNAGESWDETGSPDANEAIESFLLGQTNLASSDDRSLGQLYNPLVLGKRVVPGPGELVFQYGVVGGNQLRTGTINYIVPPGLLGDYNDDGTVDAADYTVYRNRQSGIDGSTLLAINEGATPGVVTIEDYQVWKDNYGNTLGLGSGSSVASSENVPEPASLTLLALGIFAATGLTVRGRRV